MSTAQFIIKKLWWKVLLILIQIGIIRYVNEVVLPHNWNEQWYGYPWAVIQIFIAMGNAAYIVIKTFYAIEQTNEK